MRREEGGRGRGRVERDILIVELSVIFSNE